MWVGYITVVLDVPQCYYVKFISLADYNPTLLIEFTIIIHSWSSSDGYHVLSKDRLKNHHKFYVTSTF